VPDRRLPIASATAPWSWTAACIYWTGWIAHHHCRRRKLLAGAGGLTVGLVLLGFTAVYREGFEIVLFLQDLRLKYGAPTVLEGVDPPRLHPSGLAGDLAGDLPDRRDPRSAGTRGACRDRLYVIAEHVRVRRPARRGLTPARLPELPPDEATAT
jgi:hypothetical protein